MSILGFLEYLLDRKTETEKEGHELKYETIKTLANSSTSQENLGHGFHTNICKYAKQGPFYSESDVSVDLEMNWKLNSMLFFLRCTCAARIYIDQYHSGWMVKCFPFRFLVVTNREPLLTLNNVCPCFGRFRHRCSGGFSVLVFLSATTAGCKGFNNSVIPGTSLKLKKKINM